MPPKEIVFPDVPQAHSEYERDCVWFPAVVDGEPVGCLVSLELLMQHFGLRSTPDHGMPSEQAMLDAYHAHRPEIQDIARHHIENGWIDEERVWLTTRFTRLSVEFSEDLISWPQGLSAARTAHAILLGLIGPRAGKVSVRWGREQHPTDGNRMLATIIDPTTETTVRWHFTARDIEDPSALRVFLATAWGAILRHRSQRLIQKSG